MSRQVRMLNKNKRAISELIAVVLMISMALALSGMVYAWLKFYVSKPLPEELCPEGISVIISDHQCYVLGANRMLNITFKNQGRFDIDQVIVKINNETGKEAFYPLFETRNENGALVEYPFVYTPFSPFLSPNEKQTKMFSYEDYKSIETIEVEPTKGTDRYGRPILCKNAITKLSFHCP